MPTPRTNRPNGGHAAAQGQRPDGQRLIARIRSPSAVDTFSDQVGVPAVPGVLRDHVEEYPSQGHLGPHEWAGVIELVLSSCQIAIAVR